MDTIRGLRNYLCAPSGLTLLGLGEHLFARRIVDRRPADRLHRSLGLYNWLRFTGGKRRVDFLALQRIVGVLVAASVMRSIAI